VTGTVRGGRAIALASGLMLAGSAAWTQAGEPACLELASHPDRRPLAQVAGGEFEIAYVHSVTRTPVTERYSVEGATIVQTELRFVEHGPGLPTEADAGQRFERRPGGYVVTLERRFHEIVMRIGASQSPRLAVGSTVLDLAAWGDRPLVLSVCGKAR
jgi:hypothetical protein